MASWQSPAHVVAALQAAMISGITQRMAQSMRDLNNTSATSMLQYESQIKTVSERIPRYAKNFYACFAIHDMKYQSGETKFVLSKAGW
jgi:outer membrane phospholipase A